MNKRIRELQAQAFLECKAFEDGAVIKTDDAFEKFAELIVKECMKAADEGMAQVTMKVEWPSYHIKKHFGVEE